MAGVLLLLSLVLLVPIGSGGLRSRPAHLPDQGPHEGHARQAYSAPAASLVNPCTQNLDC